MEQLLSETRATVQKLTSKPERLLEAGKATTDLFTKAKSVTKVIYDLAKVNEGLHLAGSTLDELVIEDFDEEQVWAGVELQNVAAFEAFKAKIENLSAEFTAKDKVNILLGDPESRKRKRLEEVTNLDVEPSKKTKLDDDIEFDDDLGDLLDDDDDESDEDDIPDLDQDDDEVEDSDEEEEQEEEDGDDDDEDVDEDEIFNDPDFQNMSDSDLDDKLPLFENADTSDEEAEKELDRKEQEKEAKESKLEAETEDYMATALKGMRKNMQKTEVDDQFFKLREMENFLDAEDAKEDRKRLREEKGMENDDEDDDIDLFADDDGEEEDGEEDTYDEYFGKEKSSENENENDDDEGGEEEEEEDEGFNPTPTMNDLLAQSDDEDDEQNDDLGEVKSSFEQRQLRLKKKIAEMEKEAVADEQPWQMKGEVAGPARPENSLVEEHLEYDYLGKKAPEVTEEFSQRLEDIILRRVKDKAWDDVERKIKPVEDPYEYKKRLVLDQEKSKLSLAEIYEQEYLAQKGDLEAKDKVTSILDQEPEETPEQVEEIRKKMRTLFAKLDTLTHFNYTPRASTAEVKVIRNAPSIAMEEVAPVTHSDAQLLAPSEMDGRSKDKNHGEAIAKDERTDTDKKRERRKKKAMQKSKAKAQEKREKLVAKANPGFGNKYSKERMMKDLERMEKKGEGVKAIKNSKDKSVKSSSAFFEQLQEESRMAVSGGKKAGKIEERSKAKKKANSFKLG